MPTKTGVIVFTHGSRLKEGNDIMLRAVDALRAHLPGVPVEPGFMELAEPDMYSAIDRLVAAGCDHILGYALFLVPGKHLQEDIPAIFRCALAKHPGVTWEITEPMLDDPALLRMMEQRIRRALTPDAVTV
ncbi:MAG: CbiX/SirB N-terminal domain-containing protein [Verrucomicrobiae bacterium]|nr:CbiX/SirB N-terminal domain-containing protein [Verrucomicrobiae bacterium]